eukprot:513421_1
MLILKNIYKQYASNLNIATLGQHVLYTENIYSENISSLFALFYPSEFGEQGCYISNLVNTNIYVPQYNDLSPVNNKKLNIYCHRHRCECGVKFLNTKSDNII